MDISIPTLSVSLQGPSDAPSVLLAHGFGQTRHAWDGTIAELLKAGFQCISYDARGHGQSARNPPELAYQDRQFCDDLIELAGALPQPPVLVAASMGGLAGMLAEARWPGLFRAMVLVDITPRWDIRGVERILAFMSAHPQGFDSLEAAADAIAAYLPHRPRKNSHSLQRVLERADDGRWYWHWDPRLVPELGAIDDQQRQAQMVQAATQIRCPVLLISGGRSDLVSADSIHEFLSLVPQAEHLQLANATHMLAGDDNTAFTAAVLHYLQTLPALDGNALPTSSEQVTGA